MKEMHHGVGGGVWATRAQRLGEGNFLQLNKRRSKLMGPRRHNLQPLRTVNNMNEIHKGVSEIWTGQKVLMGESLFWPTLWVRTQVNGHGPNDTSVILWGRFVCTMKKIHQEVVEIMLKTRMGR